MSVMTYDASDYLVVGISQESTEFWTVAPERRSVLIGGTSI